ncbi:MAG: serine hydrolase [Bacteroidota bacterium]
MKIFKRIVLVVLLLVIGTAIYNYPKLNIISGYAAKNMASSVFIADRTAASVTENDNNVPLIKLAKVSVDEEAKTATASVFGLMERTAVYREGLGCVLLNGEKSSIQKGIRPKRVRNDNDLPFPYGNKGTVDTVFSNVDYAQLEKALDQVFSKPETRKTRTALVVYKGHIIGERYLDGFTKDTPILGWSMTKSILATLYGILAYQGKIDIDTYKPFKEHPDPDLIGKDPREGITLDHLLRMQSGLAWDEDYGSISDVTQMLFLESDMTKAQGQTEIATPPNTVRNYSSGTTNMLSGILRKQFADHQAYLDFPYTELIDKIGMHSMLLETDLAGNFVGSSYGWANTRDWAKFGLLYLNKGNWNGTPIFDPSWVDYVTTPADASKKAGAHFWLNAGGKHPDVPRDMFSVNGYQGQRIFIIPSKDLVVVRTGLAEAPDFDANAFLSEVLAAIR